MQLMSSRQQRTRPSRGAAYVEFAIAFPLMLLMMAFVIDAGRVLFVYSRLTYALNETARFVSAELGRTMNSTASCVAYAAQADALTAAYKSERPTLLQDFEFEPATVLASAPYPTLELVARAENVRCLWCTFFGITDLEDRSVMVIEEERCAP